MKQKRIINFIKKRYIRLVLTLICVGLVFVAPWLAQSRYRAYLNGFTALIGKEYYFSSDFLTESHSQYVTNGWDMTNKAMDKLEIRNYDNTLLTNQIGQDLSYLLEWKVEFQDKDQNVIPCPLGAPYTLKVEHVENEGDDSESTVDNISPEGDTGSVTGTLVGDGNAKAHQFLMTIEAPTTITDTMVDQYIGYSVVVTLTAENVGGNRNQYYRKLASTFRYVIAKDDKYANVTLTKENDKSVDVTVTTDTIITGTTKNVYLWWRTDKLSPNRFNSTFNKLYMANNYTVTTSNAKEYGVLTIPTTSLSNRTIQLQKVSGYTSSGSLHAMHFLPETSYVDAQDQHYIGYYTEIRKSSSSNASESNASESNADQDGSTENKVTTTDASAGI